jgi:hypothetical protein
MTTTEHDKHRIEEILPKLAASRAQTEVLEHEGQVYFCAVLLSPARLITDQMILIANDSGAENFAGTSGVHVGR